MSKKQNNEQLQLVIDEHGGRWQVKGTTPNTKWHRMPTGKYKAVEWLKPFYTVKEANDEARDEARDDE